MSTRDPVIIVGAGPAGLAVAAILAQAGVASRVFEAEEKLPRDLRAGSIHPPTLELLDTIGVAQDFLAMGIVVPRWQIRGRAEGVIVEWDLSLLKDETPYPYRFHCEQFKLTPLLKTRLEARSSRRWPLVVMAMSRAWPSRVRIALNSETIPTMPAPQQGLAAGQPDLGDAQADKDARQAQIVGDRHLGKLWPIVAGAAVDALVVAAVGDRDAQIADAASEFVGEKHAIRRSLFA